MQNSYVYETYFTSLAMVIKHTHTQAPIKATNFSFISHSSGAKNCCHFGEVHFKIFINTLSKRIRRQKNVKCVHSSRRSYYHSFYGYQLSISIRRQ